MIEPNETEIAGHWLPSDAGVVADTNCARIEELVHGHLRQLGRDASGWEVLYRDPQDGRFWELTYPESHMHGGGPPTLRWLTNAAARAKYGDVTV